jgi:hypothetical protein
MMKEKFPKIYHVLRNSIERTSRVQCQSLIDCGVVIDNVEFFDPVRLIKLFIHSKKDDIIIFHAQTMLLNLFFFSLLRLGFRNIIFDIHDISSDAPRKRSIKYITVHYLTKYAEQMVFKFKIKTMTVSKGLCDYYKAKYHINPFLMYSVPRIKREELLENICKNKHRTEKLVYFGAITPLRLPLIFLERMASAKVKIDFYGIFGADANYNEKLDQLSRVHGWRYMGEYEGANIIDLLPKYVAVVMYFDSNDINITYCMPNKLFQGLSAGLPFILSENLLEVRSLLEPHGLAIKLEDLEHLQSANLALVAVNLVSTLSVDNSNRYLKFLSGVAGDCI